MESSTEYVYIDGDENTLYKSLIIFANNYCLIRKVRQYAVTCMPRHKLLL